ncbi:TetR/AcrR family transcriptional regulator [uncultured Modestobacter sp.]|uniref:TetR/AcrR family transcriptional regulator n=1 Tax=uncultured Modestobacter sp. TaxID=380048 RepID=UPI0026384802|nr:TetR/AcrR family transcriptional regulator [uncultured Modestobacter sp.]
MEPTGGGPARTELPSPAAHHGRHPGGLAATHADETVRRIERAALDLFIAEPMEGVSVARIAAAAGVSVRSFYRRFPGKEDVLLVTPTSLATEVQQAIDRRPAGEPPFAAMREAVDERSRAGDEDLRRWQAAVAACRAGNRMIQQVVAVTSPLLSAAFARRCGQAPTDPWPDIAGVIAATALVTGARRFAVHGGELREHVLQAIDVVGRGLDAPPFAAGPTPSAHPA